MTVGTDFATREELQALTAAQSLDRERIAKLEGQVGESDKRLATKADVAAVLTELAGVRSELRAEIADVKSDIRVLRIWLVVGFVLLAVWEKIDVLDLLIRLIQIGG